MKNKLTVFLLIGVIALAALVGGGIFYLKNIDAMGVEVPSFYGYTKSEVTNWMAENNVSGQFIIKDEYSDTIEEGLLISVEPDDIKTLGKKDIITLTFSAGVDPNSDVTLINFDNMTKEDIERWCTKNKMSNVTFEFVESDTVKPNYFIKHNITADTISRKESVLFTIAQGSEVAEGDIVVPDFMTMTQTEIDNWAKENKVNIKYNKQETAGYADGQVISQSVEAGKGVAEDVTITVTVAGKAAQETVTTTDSSMVPVENMVGKTKNDAIAMCKKINVLYRMVVVIDKAPRDTVVDQDVKTGNVPVQCTLRFDISGGPLVVDSFKGRNIAELENYVYEMNQRYTTPVNIQLNKWGQEVDDDTPDGTILWMNHNAQEITGTIDLKPGDQIEACYAIRKAEENKTE